MTTKSQKEGEERYVKMLLDGLTEYTSIEASERPDFWVRRSTVPDLALEVTEYHPAAEGLQGIRRSAVEARWWKELGHFLDRERRARPALQEVKVHLGFKDPRLPKRGEHADFARELVRLVEAVAPHANAPTEDIEVEFAPRAAVAAVGSRLGDSMFLAAEDWPESSERLSLLLVSRWPGVMWPPWLCQDVAAAWLSPSVEELRRVLAGKAAKAQGYNLGGAPLWLLVVCEVLGDLQSHIFPGSELDLAQLVAALQATGFDFQKGPFNQVWLLSAFGGGRLPLHLLPT
jgi:hypothetical protein